MSLTYKGLKERRKEEVAWGKNEGKSMFSSKTSSKLSMWEDQSNSTMDVGVKIKLGIKKKIKDKISH
jgi:hypothetical protein